MPATAMFLVTRGLLVEWKRTNKFMPAIQIVDAEAHLAYRVSQTDCEERCEGSLLHEVHQAVRGNMRRLAAMGVRSLIEHLMISKVGDLGTFQKNLDAFHEKGYISLVERDCVRTLLDAGDAATHIHALFGERPNEASFSPPLPPYILMVHQTRENNRRITTLSH
jgi:hypothetical protein